MAWFISTDTKTSGRQMTQTRRQFAALGLASLATPALSEVRLERRISGVTIRGWREHFESLRQGAILCDTQSRIVYYWSEDGLVERIYPSSVPLTDELTRRGRTEVTLKRDAPEWRPTPSMIERNPDLPRYVGPGPENPLGTRALNLSWQYYRIHGTNDERKIGRRSSNGCIGLFNEHIEELFEMADIGTQVVLL